jgi:hypothetical protein
MKERATLTKTTKDRKRAIATKTTSEKKRSRRGL